MGRMHGHEPTVSMNRKQDLSSSLGLARYHLRILAGCLGVLHTSRHMRERRQSQILLMQEC